MPSLHLFYFGKGEISLFCKSIRRMSKKLKNNKFGIFAYPEHCKKVACLK